MAYGVVLGQTPTATNVSYNNSATSSIITGTNVQAAIDQLFTSVSNGKELIANAITDKGVATSATDTFATMAQNIGEIKQISGIYYLGEIYTNAFGTYTNISTIVSQLYVEQNMNGGEMQDFIFWRNTQNRTYLCYPSICGANNQWSVTFGINSEYHSFPFIYTPYNVSVPVHVFYVRQSQLG